MYFCKCVIPFSVLKNEFNIYTMLCCTSLWINVYKFEITCVLLGMLLATFQEARLGLNSSPEYVHLLLLELQVKYCLFETLRKLTQHTFNNKFDSWYLLLNIKNMFKCETFKSIWQVKHSFIFFEMLRNFEIKFYFWLYYFF